MQHRLLTFLVLLATFSTVTPQVRSRGVNPGARPARPIPTVPPFKATVGNTALERPVMLEQYFVGPGDVFLVTIFGTEPYLIQATVTPARQLIIPQIGSFGVQGLTAAQVRSEVLNKIKAFYPTYEADCTLYGIRQIKVSLSGAVAKVGMYNATPLTRLITLLRQGGGWLGNGALHRLEIHNGGSVAIVDMYRYMLEGDMAHNPLLREGDQVIVPYSALEAELISVRGLTVSPTYYSLRPGETVGEFLSRWITAKQQVDLSQVEIYRRQPELQMSPLVVQLAEYGEVVLEAGDIIYVMPFEEIAVLGEVRRPGRYPFQPGLSAADYLTHAGGVGSDGSPGRVRVTHKDGASSSGPDTPISSGDVISVPRSLRALLVGQTGLVQVLLAVFNIYLTFLAATR